MIRATVNDDSLKNSLAVSASLHVLFLLFLYFGLPILFKPPPSHHAPVPFEIVEIAELTNTRVKDLAEPEPPAPPPAPAPKTQSAPTAAPRMEEKVEAIALPKPAEKPKPPEVTKPKDDFSKLLKDITKQKAVEAAKPVETKPDAKTEPEKQAASLAPTLSDRLTITQEDLLRRQISQCWNMPIGARDAHNLIVEVVIIVNPDRTVQSAEVVDQTRMATDTFFRAAAEAALRALKNPKCSPLELPADKYDQWKRIKFNFDPRDML